jgi:hypothetical protein
MPTMLLPSALSCDSHSTTPHRGTRLFSPPPARDSHSQTYASPILTTCRTLQSLLGVHPPAPKPTRPTLHRTSKIVKRPPPAPRGRNKRRRDECDDGQDQEKHGPATDGFSTPKRRRRAPPSIPLGLRSSDFDGLRSPGGLGRQPTLSPAPLFSALSLEPTAASSTALVRPAPTPDAMAWGPEDDRALVDLVLEKLRLTRRDWDECARVLGADQATLGRRWRLLVGEGYVGLGGGFGRGRRPRGEVRGLEW